MAGDGHVQRGDYGDSANPEDRWNQPEPSALGGNVGVERFDGEIGEILALHRILQHSLQIFLRLAGTNLSANAGGEFSGVEGKGDHIIGAKVEGASALQRATLDEHDDLERPRVWARLELAD